MATLAGQRTVKLNNGTFMPVIGLGALEAGMNVNPTEKERIVDSIVHALREGYRLIDTARAYNTEAFVGEAIRKSGIPREEITVVTKLFGMDHHDPQTAFNQQLADLGLDYIDVYLMHWPVAFGPDQMPIDIHQSPTFVEVWRSMEKLVGPKLKSIGVSNFSQKTLDTLLEQATIKPVVNQIEVHVQYPSFKLVEYCQRRGIEVMAWAPLAGGPNSHYTNVENVYSHPDFQALADQHQCSVGVILLSWLVQRNIVVIPHSASHARMSQNLKLATLADAEMEQISHAHEKLGRLRLADHVPMLWRGDRILGWTKQEIGWEDEDGNWLV